MASPAVPAATPSRDTAIGIAAMVVFTVLAPFIDVLAKIAAQDIPPAEVSIARFVAQFGVLMPLVVWRGELTRVTRRILALHALRGVAVAMATIFFVSAIRLMPVADALAIFFVSPLFLTLLGGLVLGEKVGWRRYAACAVGFAGALIVIRPSFAELGWAALLPVGSAALFIVYVLPTRFMGARESIVSMQAFAGLFGLIFVTALLFVGEGSGSPVFDPVWPNASGWALLALIGGLTTISHLFLTTAFAKASASILAPLQYLEIVTATILGWLVFSDLPDATRFLGIAIVVGSGLYIIWRERVAASRS